MRAKTISRSKDVITRERSCDIVRVWRNYDPILRPQANATECVRASTAAKLDKIFARPFLWAMEGHVDAVSCMAKNPSYLKGMFSGSMDGDIRLWDLSSRRAVCQFPGHQGAVQGLTTSTDGHVLVSCGTDCTVRLWKVPVTELMDYSSDHSSQQPRTPLAIYVRENAFWAVDHQWDGVHFATGGAQVDIWNVNRSEPVSSFGWVKDTTISVRFNPGVPNLLATSSSDRSITLYDVRLSSPLTKLIMKTKTNSISWNPMEPMNFTAVSTNSGLVVLGLERVDELKGSMLINKSGGCFRKSHERAIEVVLAQTIGPYKMERYKFSRGLGFWVVGGGVMALYCQLLTDNWALQDGKIQVQSRVGVSGGGRREEGSWPYIVSFLLANEDCNCYSYDARKLDEAKCVHEDHVSAVMDIDYSPTGREFVTGSYDRSVRIFQYNGGHSREIYHSKRMQRVFSVKFSCDGTYVISGSDDSNLRLWKAEASEQLGILLPRERKKHEHDEAVKNRYKHLPGVKRIMRHRHLPKSTYNAVVMRRTMIEAQRKKYKRKEAHSAPGSMTIEPKRKRRIIRLMIDPQRKKDVRTRTHGAPGSMPPEPMRRCTSSEAQ
ncbi:hypothetical protein IFM89_010302 [Coptis chinensis]|uniref:DDB1- and CUL4-associated factor 13 n=1 Tax=Coptis chinensis TaxID=261450 RepID=A0A835H2T8_9MAGN|nr:hypothetical protein IFM89_010302 [Coptis chinensis]